jgi:hypothetical protein
MILLQIITSMEYEVARKKKPKTKGKKGKKGAKKGKKTRKSGLSNDARGILQYLEGGGAVISRNYPSQAVPVIPPQQQAQQLAVRLQLPNTQMAGLMRQMFAGRQQLPRQMGQQSSQLYRDQTYQQALDLKNQIQAEKGERLRLETKVANDELVFRQALTQQETRANTLMNQLQNTQARFNFPANPLGGGGDDEPASPVFRREGSAPSFASFSPRNPFFSRANSVVGEGIDVAFLAESDPELGGEMSPIPMSRATGGGGVARPMRLSVSESESSGETIDPQKLDAVLNATDRGISGRIGEIHREEYLRNAPTGRVVLPDRPYPERRPRRSAREPKPNPRFAEGEQAPFGGVGVRIPDLRRQIAEITGVSQNRIKISRTGRGARAELASLRDEVSGFSSRGLQGGSAIEALKQRQRVQFAE